MSFRINAIFGIQFVHYNKQLVSTVNTDGFSSGASVATVLSGHLCILCCLWVNANMNALIIVGRIHDINYNKRRCIGKF